MDQTESLSPETVLAYAQNVVDYGTGLFVSYMIHLGDKLGLYAALSESGPVSAGMLADTTGYKERWLLEWLRGQAAAGLVEYKGEDTFALSPAAVPILVDAGNPFYLAGIFDHPNSVEELDRVGTGFETGLGVSYGEQGGACACNVKRITGPSNTQIVEFLKRVDGLHARLTAGAHVIDVGCGAGVALRCLAVQYPNSTFEGIDPAESAIALALEEGRKVEVPNLSYRVARGEDLPQDGRYDLALTLDIMHDLTFPDKVLTAIRGSLKPDGILVIKDIKCSDSFEENLQNPFAPMLYGLSVVMCMSAALSEPGGAGLGTMGFNPTLARQMTKSSGFSSFQQIPVEEDVFNNFYEVRI